LPGSARFVRLVADENCDFSVVVDLRLAGYDVVSITERMPGADDETVIEFARSERRLLITEDKDFGQLVFAAAKQNSGVILIRYPASTRSALTAALLKLLSDNGENLYSRFAVLEPGRVRVAQLVM
jgi:predicted nuclease of predicted toxin-antitoxin system